MSDAQFAIAISLLNVGIAGAVAYVLYRIIVPKWKSRGPIDTARRSTAYICAIVVLVSLPKLFHARSLNDTAEAYAALIIGLIFWGILALVVGWLVGKFFLKYENPADQG